jgi:protein tyrosine/serine phosphatase
MNIRILRTIVFAIFLATNLALADSTNELTVRPATWATKLDRTGLSNFYEVTTNLYRGAQPTAKGMTELHAMGIKTVLNLRSFHSDHHLASSGDFKLARLHMKPWHAEDEDVVAFLKIASNTNNLPVFVHCQRGADRTGMVCAMYRVVLCGWTKEAAIQEMKDGGFSFNPGWQNLIDYINKVDVEALKKRAGIVARASRP